MVAGIQIAHGAAASIGFLLYDMFKYFSWWVYLTGALIYSALTFSGEWSKDGPLIFSRTNARPPRVVIAIHMNFLLVLLLMQKILVTLDPSTPDWMTRSIGRGSTTLDIFFIVGMLIMSFIERRLLYLESEADCSEHRS